MFRTAILRSAAVASRTTVRSVPKLSGAAAAARLTASPAMRMPKSFVPKVAGNWVAVRGYASAGGLDRTEVYERIKQLLQGFDKVGFSLGFLVKL